MVKKRFLSSLLIILILISSWAITPGHVNAGWFGERSFAATFASFFSKVRSFITSALTPRAAAPAVVRATCIPPVPLRPAGTDAGSKYGSLAVTPEISTAGPNNIITISVTTNLEAPEHISFMMPIGTGKNDLIDWYPKDPSVVRFNQYNTDGEKGSGSYGWGVVNDKTKLPTNQTYWVKIRARYSTIPERAKDTADVHGWRKIQYSIGNRSTSSRGTQRIYVGREQKPSLITTIQNYDPKYQTFYGKFLKPFTVVPNGYFEIQTKSLGQPGMVTIAVKNAKILGSNKQHVKADETIAWKIQPLGKDPVRLLALSLTNACGEDHFVDPAKSATLADFDKFTFPVVYDAQVSVPVVVPKKSEPQPKPPAPTTKPAPSEQSKKIFPQNLVISPNRSLDGLREGDKVTFTAKLVMSDGSTQIAKDNVKWTLIGQVGNITPTGVFTAKLDEAVAEYGESSGIITATYVSADGASFIGKTPTFRVEAFMPDGGGEEG